MSVLASASPTPVEFDLRGVVGLRIEGGRPADVEKVQRQLGLPQRRLDREPDIIVRFWDDIEIDYPLTFATWPEAGFTEESFYILRGRGDVPARARIPFDDVGGRCVIDCERRMPVVPLLLAIVNFTALARGVLPLHASAVEVGDTGVLIPGWAKGGKTETLLAMAEGSGRYVADEWVYVTLDRRMFGIPEPMRLWHWQLQQLPWVPIAARDRWRLRSLDAVCRVGDRVATSSRVPALVSGVVRRGLPVVRRQLNVQHSVDQLFGSGEAADCGVDLMVLAMSTDTGPVELLAADGSRIGRSMVASLEAERQPFMSYYRQFRYAFPDRSSTIVENAVEIERSLLDSIVSDIPSYVLRHPYPVEIRSLREPVERLVRAHRDVGQVAPVEPEPLRP